MLGFTLVVFDTPGADSGAVRMVAETADLCLLPARPTHLDLEATAATFRAVTLAKRRAAFVLNQCPSTYRSSRASDAAKELTQLGVLAEPMLSARIDFQDAIAAGLGVTEYAADGAAAQEIEALWSWVRTQLKKSDSETPQIRQMPRTPSLSDRLAGIGRHGSLTRDPVTPAKPASRCKTNFLRRAPPGFRAPPLGGRGGGLHPLGRDVDRQLCMPRDADPVPQTQ